MSTPALVTAKLEGAVVHDAAPLAVSGLSGMGGTHRLYVGEGPDLVLYDSGGVFGSAHAWPVSREEGRAQLWLRWADGGQVLLGQARFGGTRSAGFCIEGDDAVKVADQLAPLCILDDPAGALRGGVPLGVGPDFVADREALIEAVSARSEAAAGAVKALVTPFKEARSPRVPVGALLLKALELPAADAALVEVLACGECFVRVAVHDHRLLLSRDAPGDVADIPCAQLVFAEDALVGSVMVAGFEVEGLRIPVDDPAELAGLRAHFGGTTAAIPRGTTDQVALHDGTGERTVDLVLTKERISLRERDGSLVHAFDLGTCAIQGTSTDFLVVDETAGPFRIRPRSTRFQQRILDHKGVALAAERTARDGPFLGVDAEERPVSIHVSGGLGVRGAAVPGEAPLSYEVDDERPWLVVGSWRFSAPSEVLEQVANHLAARSAQDLDLALKALPELELDWVLHGTFGGVVQAHRALVDAVGEPLRPPEDADERLLVLTRLSERVAWLRRQVQLARVQLPDVVRRTDARTALIAQVPMPAPRWRLEALADVERQLDRIEDQLAQLDWLKKALTATTPGYGRLATQLGMSIINPLRLVGSGAEAVRVAAIKRMVALAEAEGSEQVAIACIDEWSHLVRVLVPAAARELVSGLQPARRALSQSLRSAERTTALEDLVARRYARLLNHSRFPAAVGEPPRAEAIATLRAWMDQASSGLGEF